MEPLQTMFDLKMFTFPWEEVRKEDENRNLWTPIVDHGAVESLNAEDRDAGRARYSSRNKLLLVPVESDDGRVWSAKQITGPDV